MLPNAPSPGEKQPDGPQLGYAPGVTKIALSDAVGELTILTMLTVLTGVVEGILVATIGVTVLTVVIV
jgi:hypothetical protein